MAVAFDAHTESHTGTTGSVSEASFTWNHAGAASGVKGFLLFTFNATSTANDALSVTYGGVNVPAVTGGRAVDTALEPGDAKAWFLGAGVLQGTQAVVVTRNNTANVLWGNSVTVLAAVDTEPFGVLLEQEDQAMTEENIDDGSPGTNSLRFCGVNSGKPGGADVPAGANSTDMGFIDFTPRVIKVVRETTAGQGARPVGIDATSDDIAAVYLAVREAAVAAGADPYPYIGGGYYPVEG